MNKIFLYSQCQFSLLALRYIARSDMYQEYKEDSFFDGHYSDIHAMTKALQSASDSVTVFFRLDMQSGKGIKALCESIIGSENKHNTRVFILGEEDQSNMACSYLGWQGIYARFIDIRTPVADIRRTVRRDMLTDIHVPENPARLSKRESDVMSQVLRGDSPECISVRLGINRKTVYGHRKHALEKMGCETFLRGHLLLREWM